MHRFLQNPKLSPFCNSLRYRKGRGWLCVCLLLLSACQQHRVLVPNGLKYLQLGDPMIPPATHKLKGKFVRDTLFSEGEYSWRAAILDYPQGKVYVESDFYGQNFVNRIRVEAPQLIFRDQLYAGMTLGELAALPWEWEVYYLESYQVWDLSSPAFHNLHLLVPPVPGKSPESLTSWKDLPADLRVHALVFL